MNRPLLSEKSVLITGATSGIGKAIALLFLAQGANVVGVGTSQEKGARLLAEAAALGFSDRLHFERCDVSSKNDVTTLFTNFFDRFKSLDVLINNAGVTKDGLLMRMSLEDWQRVLDVNLTSCYLTCQLACRPMMKARSGRIINISSVVGLTGNPGQTNYAASKAGMIGFTKSLARELAPRNILVNCIAPGFVDTEMTHAIGSEKIQTATQAIPLGRMGTAEEIAQAALFLASGMASYITGQVLVVDGGLSMA